MKVILLHDVAKIGRRHSEVEVPDGFARNKLIPMKAAVPATSENRKRYGALMAHAVSVRAGNEAALAHALTVLTGVLVIVRAGAVNQQGHLYKAVSKDAVVTAVAAHGVTIAPSAVVFNAPIKEVGEHTITLANGAVCGTIIISVTAT